MGGDLGFASWGFDSFGYESFGFVSLDSLGLDSLFEFDKEDCRPSRLVFALLAVRGRSLKEECVRLPE